MAVVIAHLRSRHSHTQTAAESPPPGPSAERESGSCLLLCAGLPECPGDAVRRSPLRASVPPWGERRSARGRRALPLPQRSLAPTLLSPHAATAPSTGSLASRRTRRGLRSEEHTSELQSPCNLVCRLLLEKKKIKYKIKA